MIATTSTTFVSPAPIGEQHPEIQKAARGEPPSALLHTKKLYDALLIWSLAQDVPSQLRGVPLPFCPVPDTQGPRKIASYFDADPQSTNLFMSGSKAYDVSVEGEATGDLSLL